MLVLTRKLNESIVINDNIRITVIAIRGNQIRLGIEAPDCVPIYREELYRAKRSFEDQAERSAASQPVASAC